MVENKTRPTERSVEAFIEGVESARKRDDARTLLALFERLSGHPPTMWGSSMVGFGSYRYKAAARATC